MSLHARQPFAELGSPRLQRLQNVKNTQNAIGSNSPSKDSFSFNSPLKSSAGFSISKSSKRRLSSSFDDFDSENIDPSIFTSPTKKSKHIDGTPKKASKFILTDAITSSAPAATTARAIATPKSPLAKRKGLSSINTSHNTPSISFSRGSPKHKRVGLLSKRRTSGSPFQRIDPLAFSLGGASTGLPFSIDAALSGTISSYTPKAARPEVAKPKSKEEIFVPTLEESMPKGWFFDIHEDSPEEEAANLMEHSALTLDISSDDDADTKRRKDDDDRGKENVPPPDHAYLAGLSPVQGPSMAEGSMTDVDAVEGRNEVLKAKLKLKSFDAMEEDRKALGDLNAADYYGEGLDAESYIIVDGPEKSSLANEVIHDDVEPQPEASTEVGVVEAPAVEPLAEEKEEVVVFQDEAFVAPAEEANAAEVEVTIVEVFAEAATEAATTDADLVL